MICSVNNCPFRKHGIDVPSNISFYEFPSDLEAFNAWVAATGRENFMPNLSSKICSQHFDARSFFKSSGKLKKSAVPTLFLGGKSIEKVSESRELQNPLTDFVTCILGQDAEPLDVSQSSHKPVNVVLSSNQYLLDPENTVVLNYDKSVKSNVSAVGPELQVRSKSIPTADSRSSQEIMCSQASATNQSKPSPCPIKLVDMKKLLEKPPIEGVETTSFIHNSFQKANEGIKRTIPQSPVQQSNFNDDSSKSSSVTVSSVFDCLRVILPRSFVLARLKPSDKVAALVIKYLKLDDIKSVENTVKINLKIIIDAAKLEDKVFGNYFNHPYHKISEIPLRLALTRVFPENFSISDVTNEKLKCLCVVLSQDFFTDGIGILSVMIEKFIRTEKKSKEAIEQRTKKNNPLPSEKTKTDVHRDDNKTSQTPNKRQKLTVDQQNYPVKDSSNTHINDEVSCVRKSKIITNEKISDEHHQKDTCKQNENRTKIDKRARLTANLKLILKYISLKKCSVQDVLNDSKRMIELCQHLSIRCKRSNLQKLKKMLYFIIQKKLNDQVPGMIEATINKSVGDKDSKNKIVTERQNVRQVVPQELKNDHKLKSKPVVVLQNLVDFATEQLLFMRENGRGKRKPNVYHKLRVPHCFTHNNSLQKYSSDHVRKLTSESYREFRKIVMKRDGEKVVFRLHYKTLSPGSSVFVKNFSSPLDGWFKGTVSKVTGPLRYTVKLDDDNVWSCVPEQLRPIPETEQRTPRQVKPKQLFDL